MIRIRIYRSTDRFKEQLIFESSPNDITPYSHALEKLKKFLHIQHADLVLNDITKKADDVHLAGSHYQIAAQQLLALVFKASGYELESVCAECQGHGKILGCPECTPELWDNPAEVQRG